MIKSTFVAALLASSLAAGVAHAASAPEDRRGPAQAEQIDGADDQARQDDSADNDAPRDRRQARYAEGFFSKFWGEEREGDEGRRNGANRRHHHWDDDDDEGGRPGRGADASHPADPNPAGAPPPDNGVFNGKTRPKVEVQ